MVFALGARSESERLNREFRSALRVRRRASDSAPGALVGLEHEFRVIVDGRPIDFRRLIHTLDVPGRRIDPADPNAYRGGWGGTITADGAEAEIAIAPVATEPGWTDELLARAWLGRSMLERLLPADARLEGFSTHLSVSVPAGLAERAARIYVDTFATALMLLLDGPESPGLLVRPRPGRLELGGEFVDGERLRAAAAFAAGSVRMAALAARRRPFSGRHLPPAVAVSAVPSIERFGWFVARDAAGPDLYAEGRAARLVLRSHGAVSAGAHLARAWAAVRRDLERRFAAADLAAADDLVAGRLPLGLEGTQVRAIAMASRASADLPAAGPFGSAIADRSRPGFAVAPTILSWDFAVLRLQAGARVAFACLPRPLIGAALEALDAGRLDGVLGRYLSAGSSRSNRRLAAARQTTKAGLYDAVGRAADLLAPERSPFGSIGDRPGKRRHDQGRTDQPSHHGGQTGAARSTGAAAGGVAAAAAAIAVPGTAAASAAGAGIVAPGAAAAGVAAGAAAAGAAGSAAATAAAAAGSAVAGGAAAGGVASLAGAAAGSAAAAAGGAVAGGLASATAIGGTILGLPTAAALGIGGVVLAAAVGGAVLLGGAPAASAVPTLAPSIAVPSVPVAVASPSLIISTPAPNASVIPLMTPDPSCLREPTLTSTDGTEGKSIQFVNHLQIPLQTIWIGYDGKRKKYADVPAGTSYFQGTFVTHPWMFAMADGTCLKLVVVDQSTQVIQVGP